MAWHRRANEERGAKYTDWHSDDGDWVIAEGYDEHARKNGKPYTLFYRTVERGVDRLRKIECFSSVAEAKRAAEEF